MDHGTEAISRALDQWAWENGVTLDFTRPGKPTDRLAAAGVPAADVLAGELKATLDRFAQPEAIADLLARSYYAPTYIDALAGINCNSLKFGAG